MIKRTLYYDKLSRDWKPEKGKSGNKNILYELSNYGLGVEVTACEGEMMKEGALPSFRLLLYDAYRSFALDVQ